MKRWSWLIIILSALAVVILLLSTEKTPPPIKVGILHSLTGTMAISEKAVMQATLLAIEKINAQGGLLGRLIEPIIVDGQSDSGIFAHEAERLILEEKVSVIFGCWTSASRKTVKPIFEKYNHLLFYPVQYEGLEMSPNIIYTGAAPNQQIIPAVSWSIRHFGPRIYLVGSDYVFPRVANWLIHKQAPLLNATVIGEKYLPLGNTDVSRIVQDIKQLQPDVIINTINGDSNIAFFHQLSEAGITAQDMPVMSFSIGEPELAQMHDDGDAIGHYATWNYFQSIKNQQNKNFIQAYQARFGQNLPINDPMEAAWSGVQLWAKAVLSAQTDDTTHVRQTILHQSIHAPEGIISIDHHTQHAWKTVRVGKIQSNRQFEILWSSGKPIRPNPYPSVISKHEANTFLADLYLGWDNNWALPNPAANAATNHQTGKAQQ